MISERAKDSFDRIFVGAARSRLATSEADACEVTPRPADAPPLRHKNVVVLTISSMQFRLLLLLHFDDDAGLRAYYAGDTGRPLAEAFMEVANLCCGAMNQQLVEQFPDLGMSTPYALSSACVPYLGVLKPDYVATYDVSIGGSVQIGATLCVCTVAPLDFTASDTVAADAGGELELF